MTGRSYRYLLTAALLCLCCCGGGGSLGEVVAEAGEYDRLIERVKEADPSVDYEAVRLAFAATAQYDPYDADSSETLPRAAMQAALEAANWEASIAGAQSLLLVNYVDIEAHMACERAFEAIGHDKRGVYHRNVADGLIGSILMSGDGLGYETAYVVIDIDEENVLAELLAFETTDRRRVMQGDRAYHILTGRDVDTGEVFDIYFDAGAIFAKTGSRPD